MSQEAQWADLTKEMEGFFKEFDVNNTGLLGVEEITVILKSIGLRCTTEEVREMMSEVAGPDALSIDFPKLMEILKRHTHQEDEEQTMRQAFETIDVDGDGQISPEDLQCFMQSLGEDFPLKYAERMVQAATQSKQVPVDFENYKKVLRGKWANIPSS
jgi:Ca2+-binding EF-hand superfamily protein